MNISHDAHQVIRTPQTPQIAALPPSAFTQGTVFDDDSYLLPGTSFSIDEAAEQVMNAYDRDGNDELNMILGRGISIEINRAGTDPFTVRSISKLASFADHLGNNDGRAGIDELKQAMAVYDTNGDGELSGSERSLFLDAYGEESSRRVASRPLPAPRPLDPPFGDAPYERLPDLPRLPDVLPRPLDSSVQRLESAHELGNDT